MDGNWKDSTFCVIVRDGNKEDWHSHNDTRVMFLECDESIPETNESGPDESWIRQRWEDAESVICGPSREMAQYVHSLISEHPEYYISEQDRETVQQLLAG